MDSSTCAVCHNPQLAFNCSCVFPALSICTNCIIPHIGTAGVHIPAPIKKNEVIRAQAVQGIGELCDECCLQPAVLFCICAVPPRKFCEHCDKSHYQKAASMIHLKHPISAYKLLASGQVSVEDFTRRQIYVNELSLKLSENLANLDTFMKKTESDFEALIQTCFDQKTKVMSELQELREYLTTELNQASLAIDSKRYETSYEVSTWLEHLVLRGYMTNPSQAIRVFSGSMDVPWIIDAITKSTFYSISPGILTKNYGQLPVLKGTRLRLFDVQALDMKESALKQESNANESTAYCFISPMTLLCCGGTVLNETHIVNLRTLQVGKIGNMRCNRKYAGILNFRNECVFIFGGFDGSKCLVSAEKFSLAETSWSFTKFNMNQPKQACTACDHCTGIYIAGVQSELTVEVFNPVTEQFRPLLTYATSYWPLALIQEDELVIVFSSEIWKAKLGMREVQFKKESMESVQSGHYWSNCPSVEVNREYFSVLNSSGSIYGMLKLSPIMKKVTKINSFSY